MGCEKVELKIFTFDPEDGLYALKVLEEAAELQVAFKAWGGPITDWSYSTDYYEKKTELKEKAEDELADVVISCLNLAEISGLDLDKGLARKNQVNMCKDDIRKLKKKLSKNRC